MQAVAQKWNIPKSRHLTIDLPATVPEGPADVILVFNDFSSSEKIKEVKSLIGSLKNTNSFSGDSVILQRKLRDEW